MIPRQLFISKATLHAALVLITIVLLDGSALGHATSTLSSSSASASASPLPSSHGVYSTSNAPSGSDASLTHSPTPMGVSIGVEVPVATNPVAPAEESKGGSSGFPQWIIGFLLSFFGCTLSNLGVNMQKYAHNRLAKRVESNGAGTRLISDPVWILGLLAIAVGSVADLVSFSFASMSLLAPLGAMTLVVNLFIAPIFLKEPLSRRDVLVTLIILCGTILSVVFGSKEETKYTLGQLVSLYGKPLFISYTVVVVVYIGAMIWYLKQLELREKPVALDSDSDMVCDSNSNPVSSSRSHLLTSGDLSNATTSDTASDEAPSRLQSTRMAAKNLFGRISRGVTGDVGTKHKKLEEDDGEDMTQVSTDSVGSGEVIELSSRSPSRDRDARSTSSSASASSSLSSSSSSANLTSLPSSSSSANLAEVKTTDGLVEHSLDPGAYALADVPEEPTPTRHGDELSHLSPPPSAPSPLTSGETALRAFGYPSLAGVFGAHSVLFAKSASEVVKATAGGDNQFDSPLSYFFIIFLGVMVYLQMKFLNLGLAKADALYVVPVYQVCWVVMNAVVGMTYFRDYRHMNGQAMFLFLFGIAITSFGVYLLSKRNIVPTHTAATGDEIGVEETTDVYLARRMSRYAPGLESVHEEPISGATEEPEGPVPTTMTPHVAPITTTHPMPGIGTRSRASSRATPSPSRETAGEPKLPTHHRLPSATSPYISSLASPEGHRARTGSMSMGSSTPPVQGRGRVLSIGAFHQIYLGDASDEALPTIALNVPTFETTTPANDTTHHQDDTAPASETPEAQERGRTSSIGGFFSSIFGGIIGGTAGQGTHETHGEASSPTTPDDVTTGIAMVPLHSSAADTPQAPDHNLESIDVHSGPNGPSEPRNRMGLGVPMSESMSDEEARAATAWATEPDDI